MPGYPYLGQISEAAVRQALQQAFAQIQALQGQVAALQAGLAVASTAAPASTARLDTGFSGTVDTAATPLLTVQNGRIQGVS